jgi:hypothetical protein
VCSICVFFLAKEGANCSLTPMKPNIYTPVRTEFEQGLGQKFRQDPGTGVMLALFEDRELLKGGEDNVFPLVIRMETLPKSPPADEPPRDTENLGAQLPEWVHSQITQAVIERKDDDTYQVRVVKQIIWVGGVRYELQEIYGIENSGGGGNFDGTDAGKECVVCMSEPRDTTVLPCRHMVRPPVMLNIWKVMGQQICHFVINEEVPSYAGRFPFQGSVCSISLSTSSCTLKKLLDTGIKRENLFPCKNLLFCFGFMMVSRCCSQCLPHPFLLKCSYSSFIKGCTLLTH